MDRLHQGGARTRPAGNVSVLDAAARRHAASTSGPTASTGTPRIRAQLDACEDVIVNQLAPHVKAFNSYPGINLAQGNYALSQVFNGDARQGLLSRRRPREVHVGLRCAGSELWMDNWCILKGAKNRDAAYNFLNFILTPENSATDLAFHGYDTGIKASSDLLPKDTKFPTWSSSRRRGADDPRAGQVNTAQHRQVAIFDKAKAKAGSVSERPRRRGPKFALAVPAWVWYLAFFVVPLASSSCTASATSRRSTAPAARSASTGSRSTTTATCSTPAISSRCSAQTLRISLIGTALCLAHRLPVRLLAGGEGAVALARRAPRPGDRAVLDELPDPHGRLAHRAQLQRLPVALDAERSACATRRSASSTPARPCSSASSTTTCR